MDKLLRLIEFFDSKFTSERVQIDEWGNYGTHYLSLTFDDYFQNSIFSIDYLDVYDYFETTANYNYKDEISLKDSLSAENMYSQLKLIESILNLVKKSTYGKPESDELIDKSLSFLKRLGIIIEEINDSYLLNTEMVKFRGSYCDILFVNELCYKKRLNKTYVNTEQWQMRLRREYQNMVQLSESDYVLKVYGYDENEHSYLMEVCECDLGDYIENNPLYLNDANLLQIIKDLLNGMNDVHNAGIVHRDLHLGNILRKDNHFILSDFGLSKDMMKVVSFKSSNTPKNSHMFMDPIGHTDFSKLDKLSDIYSIGKIIDYITSGSVINSRLSYLIEKCTNRERKNRYQSISAIIQDLHLIIDDENQRQKIAILQMQIKKGEFSPEIERHILSIDNEFGISNSIVTNQLFAFGNILAKLMENNQDTLLNSILSNYEEATGYGNFHNYEVFSAIMTDYIKLSRNNQLRKVALSILEGCAKYRIQSANQLASIKSLYPDLF